MQPSRATHFFPLRFVVAHTFTHTHASRRRVRTHIRSRNTLHAVIFSFIDSLFPFFLSVRLFLHFPGPLAPEEDISFHSVITGESNLHNTRVARTYRHLHFILIAVIDRFSSTSLQPAGMKREPISHPASRATGD